MSSKARSSAARKGKDPPRKKPKKNQSPASKPTFDFSSLPDDLLLNCLARVSRLYHPTLCFVCKKFKSLVASPELYKTRSLLNRTEGCLYLCFRTSPNYWFTLCKIPNRNVTSTSSGIILYNITSPNYPTMTSTPMSIVSDGSDVYEIGDGGKGWYSDSADLSRVFIMDCKSHNWRLAPSLRMKHRFSTASVVDGKIYVAGGSKSDRSVQWAEVFDPKTQTWDSVKNPRIQRYEDFCYPRGLRSFGLEGKFYFFGDENKVYDPKEDNWSHIEMDTRLAWIANPNNVTISYRVIDNILFVYSNGNFRWYDLKVSLWKDLKGLEGLPDLGQHGLAKMVDLGGKMAVLWFEYKDCSDRHIWCAEIALERRDGDEIWGKVEWFDEIAVFGYSRACEDLSCVDVLSVVV